MSQTSKVFCADCESKILRTPLVIEKRQQWTSYSLLSWNDEAEGSGRIVHSQKGGRTINIHAFFARALVRKLLVHFDFLNMKNLVFVPAPARNTLEIDHASSFAEELSKVLGGEVWPLLRRISVEEQKGLVLEERKRARLLIENNQLLQPHHQVLFIDDLIVSGSTANAAYLALGKPRKFAVLTLASRPRLQNLAKVAINSDA